MVCSADHLPFCRYLESFSVCELQSYVIVWQTAKIKLHLFCLAGFRFCYSKRSGALEQVTLHEVFTKWPHIPINFSCGMTLYILWAVIITNLISKLNGNFYILLKSHTNIIFSSNFITILWGKILSTKCSPTDQTLLFKVCKQQEREDMLNCNWYANFFIARLSNSG